MSPRPARHGLKSKRPAGKRTWRDGAQRAGFVLTVIEGPNQGKGYFFESSARLGRVEDNDIVLVQPGISRHHAQVRIEHGVHLLQDLESANGTRLNGEPLGPDPEVLRDGDYITLAESTLQFSVLDGVRGEATAETNLNDDDVRAVDVTREDSARPGYSRRIKLAVLVVIVLAGAGVVWRTFFHKRAMTAVRDQSNVPLVYSEDDSFFNAVLGLGKWDQTHVDHVMVDFDYLGGRATLQYGAWGIDKVDEVTILLNGEKIGVVPLTMGRWTYGLKLVLPRDKLKKNKTNQLTFDNTRNPPGQDEWEICYLQIIQEAIPPADAEEARERFELAKKAWEDRDVEPGNMYNALVGFKLARDYLEALPERPELYQEALDLIDRVDQTLTRRFQEGLFSARRAEKVDGDLAKARSLLARALRYFRPNDFRHRELKRYLDALAE